MQATFTASILIRVIILSPDGDCLADWAANIGLVLLHNRKVVPSFFFGRWNSGTNPDLAFASASHNSWHLYRRTLEKLPRSQHRPSLITTSTSVILVPSEPYKRWNFRRANWEQYNFITNQLAKGLSSPDTVMLMRPTRTSATPSLLQLKDLSHAVGERTTDPVGLLSVNSSVRPSFGQRKAKQLILLPQPC